MFLFYNNEINYPQKQLKRKLAILHNFGITNSIFLFNLVSNATVILKKTTLLKVGFLNEDPNLKAVEDYEYWVRCLQICKPWFCNQRLIYYRIHPNRISKPDEGKSKKKYLFDQLYNKGIINKWQYFLSHIL